MYVLKLMYSPFIKITYILTSPPPPLEQFLRAIWGGLPGCSPHFAPNKTDLATFTLYFFFLSQQAPGEN